MKPATTTAVAMPVVVTRQDGHSRELLVSVTTGSPHFVVQADVFGAGLDTGDLKATITGAGIPAGSRIGGMSSALHGWFG